MKNIEHPEYFYKYVTASIAKLILTNLEVKCSSPFLFNDPFDSQIEIQHDVRNTEELIKRATGKICDAMKHLLVGCTVEQANGLVVENMMTDTKFITDRQLAFDRFYQEVNEKIIEFAKEDRIFCLSEINDSLLMWTHYTKDHKGAVIRFRCIPEINTATCAAKPVIYSDKVPLLTIEDFFKGEQFVKNYILNEALLTKSLDWEYEREWRLILKQQNKAKDFDLRSVFEKEIDAIYLGCKMEADDKKELIDITRDKRQSITIFEAFKDRKEFKLNFKELIN